MPAASDFHSSTSHGALAHTDSGYVTEDDGHEADDVQTLRDDPLERDVAMRWLTGFISRAEQLPLDDDLRERFVEDACSVLSHLTRSEEEEQPRGDDLGMTRRFEFSIPGDMQGANTTISVDLLDTPMQTTDDHTDVGLQTWGASVALSEMLCREPGRFGLDRGSRTSRFLELGAGTGLFSLTLSSLLPCITDAWSSQVVIATDYHPAVLRNLERNLESHMARGENMTPLKPCHLDWSAPSRAAPLDKQMDFILAADAAYAPEHASWLRGCAAGLLALEGVFWLMVSIRPNGKFRAIGESVEAAFSEAGSRATERDGRVLGISSQELIDKHKIGRADETGYKLYRIGWQKMDHAT